MKQPTWFRGGTFPQPHGKAVHTNGITVTTIKARDLYIPPYQRARVSVSKIANMADHWSWMKAGVFQVGPRDKGGYPVMDGQQRLAAIEQKFPNFKNPDGSDVTILALITSDATTLGQQAEAFLGFNANTPVGRNWKFNAGVYAGFKVENEVADALRRHDLTIEVGVKGRPGPNVVKTPAVFADARRALNKQRFAGLVSIVCGFKHPDNTVDSQALRADFVNGLSQFMRTHRNVPIARLRDRLHQVGIDRISEKAQAAIGKNAAWGWGRTRYYAETIKTVVGSL